MSNPVLILGASARAAASSAIRAGLSPLAADLFCDDDLKRMIGGATRLNKYPADLPNVARNSPPGPWIYTGALENYPRIIDAIAAERILWGTPGDAVRRIRDPWQLAACLQACDLVFPEILRADQCNLIVPTAQGRWLRKPFRSAGGMNISPWAAGKTASRAAAVPTSGQMNQASYLQRAVPGDAHSAVFVAAGGAATLLGVTEQLIGSRWAGASGFRYAGSIGPLMPNAAEVATWGRIGNCLASGFKLQGLFGVDAIVNDQGIWTIEVNPRYTSSVEVLEYGLELQALTEHVDACRGRLHEPRAPVPRFRGKAVMYASRNVPIHEAFVRAAWQANAGEHWPVIADIPAAGQAISAGHPIATLFASSDRLDQVKSRLQAIVRIWRRTWNL